MHVIVHCVTRETCDKNSCDTAHRWLQNPIPHIPRCSMLRKTNHSLGRKRKRVFNIEKG